MCCMMGHDEGHGAEAHGSSGKVVHSESLADLLRRRYALGEISREQLEEMRAVLGLDGEPSVVVAGRGDPWAFPQRD